MIMSMILTATNIEGEKRPQQQNICSALDSLYADAKGQDEV